MTTPDARDRLAAGIRRLSTLVVGRVVSAGDLEKAAEAVADLADALERAASPGKAPRALPDPDAAAARDIFPTSPVFGLANPLAPPVDVWRVESPDGAPELRGRVRFAYPYEGPPTCVHGGIIAEVFDELTGAALVIAGRPGLTGTLTVRFHRPTPLQADIDLVARATTVEGRKLGAWAGMYLDGELTAEGEAVYVAVGPERMATIIDANAREAAEEVVDAGLRAYIDAGGEVVAAE